MQHLLLDLGQIGYDRFQSAQPIFGLFLRLSQLSDLFFGLFLRLGQLSELLELPKR
jgi:hypothetical protein